MDSVWPLLMFLAGLMGSGLLILICGIRDREQERAENPELAMPPVRERSFFATLAEAFEIPPEVDPGLLQGVEEHLRRQTAVATRFVDQPSIVAFHDAAEEAELATEQSLFQRIQSFLEQERILVGEFVGDPSLNRLHGQLQPVAL